MKSAYRLIAMLSFCLLLTGGVAAQQQNESRPLDRQASSSKPVSPQVEYLTAERTRPLPFSDAVRVDHMLYLSGQIGTDSSFALVTGGVKAETRQVMENIRRILERHGSSLNQVVKCTVMLADMSEWGAVNEVYVSYFSKDRLPARSALGANGLALSARVEIECWATVSRDLN